mmetsp:Transcript_18572/g.43253  ORF Transcript_18572/g.43253 Transcript_18572/m.43253 type:complete len:258 (-) Transcript_18572:95-868(-)
MLVFTAIGPVVALFFPFALALCASAEASAALKPARALVTMGEWLRAGGGGRPSPGATPTAIPRSISSSSLSSPLSVSLLNSPFADAPASPPSTGAGATIAGELGLTGGNDGDASTSTSHACSSSSCVLRRSEGSCWQHAPMKESASGVNSTSTGGRSPLAMWYMAAIGLGNMGHGILPVAISMVVQPIDQTSAFFQPCEVCCPLITSGAIQCGVPLSPLTIEFASTRFDAPKSASLQWPSAASNTFAPFMSRWAMAF